MRELLREALGHTKGLIIHVTTKAWFTLVAEAMEVESELESESEESSDLV